jgi:hypothetical protein
MQFSLSRSLSCSTTTILYGRSSSLCAVFFVHCYGINAGQWHVFWPSDKSCVTASMFGGVLTFCTGPGGLFFAAEAVDVKFCIHKFIVLWLGTLP